MTSPGFTFLNALVAIFSIGVLFIAFGYVFNSHLVPILSDMVTSSNTIDQDTKDGVIGGYEKYMTFFNIFPFVLIGGAFLWMLSSAIRKERVERY